MGVSITFQGGDKFKQELRRKKKRVQDPEEAWREVGDHIGREVRKQFATRGANFGTPWKPLAASTLAEKRRKGFPLAPLVRTGEMRREFVSRPMSVENYLGRVAQFGAKSMKSEWQQFGTKRNGKTHIPARVILKATPKLRREIKEIMDKFINGKLQ